MTDAPAAPAAGTGTEVAPSDGTTNDGTKTAPTAEELATQLEEWKGYARKHEDAAKANKTAATELAALKRSVMSDAEKAEADKATTSQAVKDATERADKAEAALIRRTIAIDLELSKEDVAVLDGVQGDEKTLRALAERLAGRKSPGPAPTRTQGRTGGSTPTAAEAFANALDGLL